MTIQNNQFTELDYDGVREAIVTHLRSKTEFEDINFEGSGIGLILDALAYTTTYMAVHSNMAITETFLDSAQLRNSIISKAKELNYLPRSKQASHIEFPVTFIHPARETKDVKFSSLNLMIPRGTQFILQANRNYTFTTTEAFNFTEQFDENGVGGIYIANIRAFQGDSNTEIFTIPSSREAKIRERFKLTNPNIDTRSLQVTITSPTTNKSTSWRLAENVVAALNDPDRDLFFLQEGFNDRFEIYFGDGVIGNLPESNATLSVNYLTTLGDELNGITGQVTIDEPRDIIIFNSELDNNLITDSDFSVETTSYIAKEGSAKETEAEIKQNAPKFNNAQNRAVTKQDYEAILKNRYGFIQSISVWGGEDNIPPLYGKIFISIKPFSQNVLSVSAKEAIRNDLISNFSIVSLTPEIVDPDILFISLNVDSSFFLKNLETSEGDLVNRIKDNIKNFFRNKIGSFKKTLRYSNLVCVIDETDEAIDGSVVNFTMSKKFVPEPNKIQRRIINFQNPIKPGTFRSKIFVDLNGNELNFKDNSKGTINLFKDNQILQRNVASIDYEEGSISFNNQSETDTRKFMFRVPKNQEITLQATPVQNDIFVERNALIELDDLIIDTNRLDFLLQDN